MAMTTMQEAAYAIDHGLDREGLRPEVRAEYDRIKQERHFASTRAAGTQQAPARHPQHLATRPPAGTIPPRKLIISAVVVALVIVSAIIGHAISSGSSIALGDCVVTNPNVLTGWDIKKVACNSNPGTALVVQKVVSVRDGSNGQCDYGLTTFQDDPAGKTYCLNDYSFGGG
jgi:hypothetical protein